MGSPQFVSGQGSGRDDTVEALLSDGEYVMDAESVALLGDGSAEEGARRLDQLRASIRQHKGGALAKGEISPDAKAPEEYLGLSEGGEVAPVTPADRMVRTLINPETSRDRQADLLGELANHPQRPLMAKGGALNRYLHEQRSEPRTRTSEVESLRRLIEAMKKSKGHKSEGERQGHDPYNYTPPPVKKAKGGEIDVAGARQRVTRIQDLAKKTPAKRSADPVKDLVAFADRLEASIGKQEEPAVRAEIDAYEPTIQPHYAKGGFISGEQISRLLDKFKPKPASDLPPIRHRTPEELRQMAEELRRINPRSEVLRSYDSAQVDRRYSAKQRRRAEGEK